MSVTIRNYRDDDLEGVVELINAADAVDKLDLGTGVNELRDRLQQPGFQPQQNVFVAQDERGRIVGSARLRLEVGPEQSFFYLILTIHPDWRQKDIGRSLFERAWERARERRHTLGSKRVYFHAPCATHQTHAIAIFQSSGLQAIRYSPHMIYRPLENLAEPQVPAGIEIRPYTKGLDDVSTLDAYNEAFAEDHEFVPLTMEKWLHWLDSSMFREELTVVALDGKEVVGLCLCTISEARIKSIERRDGYVDTLFVRPAYRGQGLGTALLLAGLHALREADMESATLDTETDNPTQAMRLYEEVGFREVWRWVAYGREMP